MNRIQNKNERKLSIITKFLGISALKNLALKILTNNFSNYSQE